MTPEEEARELIDELLSSASWSVQDFHQRSLVVIYVLESRLPFSTLLKIPVDCTVATLKFLAQMLHYLRLVEAVSFHLQQFQPSFSHIQRQQYPLN